MSSLLSNHKSVRKHYKTFFHILLKIRKSTFKLAPEVEREALITANYLFDVLLPLDHFKDDVIELVKMIAVLMYYEIDRPELYDQLFKYLSTRNFSQETLASFIELIYVLLKSKDQRFQTFGIHLSNSKNFFKALANEKEID